MLMINPQHAVSHPLQAHSALETHPCFRLILRYTRLTGDLARDTLEIPVFPETRFLIMFNVVIVGSGCAGNTAAIYAARANLKPLVVKGHEPGGQLSMTTLVENFPGFPEGINGPDLVENIRKQAENFGAEYKEGRVVEADLSRRPFKLDVE